MNSAIRFIILCSARTGSTMLRTLLDGHPNIRCHGEIMAPDHDPAKMFRAGEQPDPAAIENLKALRAADPIRFLEEYVLQPRGAAAVGFKIKYEELVRPEFAALKDHLVKESGIRVVHLFRRNRLKRLLSQLVAVRVHGQFNYFDQDAPPQARISVTAQECLQDFAQKEQWEKEFGEAFSAHPLIEVTYEELRAADGLELQRIQEFLRVPQSRLIPRTTKVNSDNIRDIVENFDAIADELRARGFERFLT